MTNYHAIQSGPRLVNPRALPSTDSEISLVAELPHLPPYHHTAAAAGPAPAASLAANGAAICQPDVHPVLTENGNLDANVPVKDHLEALANGNATPGFIQELARLYCDDVYDDTDPIFDSSDPYYTCQNQNVDVDHSDLLSASKERIHNNLSDWLDVAIPLTAADIQSRISAGISDIAEADSEIKVAIAEGLHAHGLEVMGAIARDW